MLDACRQGDVTFRDQLDNLRPLNKRIRDLQTELGFDVPCPRRNGNAARRLFPFLNGELN